MVDKSDEAIEIDVHFFEQRSSVRDFFIYFNPYTAIFPRSERTSLRQSQVEIGDFNAVYLLRGSFYRRLMRQFFARAASTSP